MPWWTKPRRGVTRCEPGAGSSSCASSLSFCPNLSPNSCMIRSMTNRPRCLLHVHALERTILSRQVVVDEQRREQQHEVAHGELENPHRQVLPGTDLQLDSVVQKAHV